MSDATMMQAQIDSLKAMLADALKGLAAGQARERKLQKALAEAMEWNWMDDDAGEIIPAWVRETLSLPQDDSALREMIAGDRGACAMIADDYDVSDDESMCEAAEGIAAAIRSRNI